MSGVQVHADDADLDGLADFDETFRERYWPMVRSLSVACGTGFVAEIHDNGPSRVEVRFSDGSNEWRIRIEPGNSALVAQITQHG